MVSAATKEKGQSKEALHEAMKKLDKETFTSIYAWETAPNRVLSLERDADIP